MIRLLLKMRRDYKDAKTAVFEKTVNSIEAKVGSSFAFLFTAILIVIWILAILSPYGLEGLHEKFEFSPLFLFFAAAYFSCLLISKILFKPTEEELSDDTSLFAVFSACSRKSTRSLLSFGISLMHTLIFTFYLVNKDLKFF